MNAEGKSFVLSRLSRASISPRLQRGSRRACYNGVLQDAVSRFSGTHTHLLDLVFLSPIACHTHGMTCRACVTALTDAGRRRPHSERVGVGHTLRTSTHVVGERAICLHSDVAIVSFQFHRDICGTPCTVLAPCPDMTKNMTL